MPSKNGWKLNPAQVRKCAELIPGCQEVSTSGDDTVLSFLVGLDRPDDKSALARVNFYVETGTIGTCRVLNGHVREVFRRNVTSLDAVKKSLKEPSDLTVIDDAIVGGMGHDGSSQKGSASSIPSKMELAEVGLAILMGERQRLESHLAHLRKQGEDEETSKDQSEDHDVTGSEFEFGFDEEVVDQVEQCLKDIVNMDKHVTSVAINGKSAVFLYGNGGAAFTPGIPKPLANKLKQLKRPNRGTTRPSYIALGSRERYYVKFYDGTADWKAHKSFDKCMKKRHETEPPRSVAFGSTYDTFFVVFRDGSWEYHGRGIPYELEEKLVDREDRPDLVCVTLGPKGEWFLRAQNGRMWWGGISEELDVLIQELLDAKRYLSFVDFGDSGSYFICYD